MEESAGDTLAGLLGGLPLSPQGCVLMKSIAYARSIRSRAVSALWDSQPGEEQRHILLFLLTHDIEMGRAKWWLEQNNAGSAALQATLLARCQAVAALRERRGEVEGHDERQ